MKCREPRPHLLEKLEIKDRAAKKWHRTREQS